MRAAELRKQWRYGSAWQTRSPNRDEAPTPWDRRVNGASDVKRVGESALRLLHTSCG